MAKSTLHQFRKYRSAFVDGLPASRDAQKLAHTVLEVSEAYNFRDGVHSSFEKVWSKNDWRDAYLAYFMPLNILRLQYVISHANELGFFDGLKHLVDFGSGPGTLDIATHENKISFESRTFIETSREAQAIHNDLTRGLDKEPRKWLNMFNGKITDHTLAAFCYSLNELSALPAWAFEAEALLIIEPSLQVHARRLQSLRQNLIAKGFSLWAPCTHHDDCPLLKHSKTDWCHQRIHVELSQGLQEIERYLPIKNQTLTFSYLLARKTPPPARVRARGNLTIGRVIGDTLFERGKVKQAVCRSDAREFLTWLTRHGEPKQIERGAIVDIPKTAEIKGSEIRQ